MFSLFRRLFMLPFQLLPLILIVVFLGLYIRTQSIDPAPFAQRVVEAVQEEVGQRMQVEGGVELEFAWPPRLVMRDVTIRNPQWAGSEAMLRVQRVEAILDPMDLLFGEVYAPRTRFVNAEIIMTTNAQGVSNWGPNGADGPGAILTRALATLGSETTELSGGRILLRNGATGAVTVVPLGGATVVTRGRRQTAGEDPCLTREAEG